jgi:agmatinase
MPDADSMGDRAIPTIGGGEPPHFAGIKTFLKAPYFENVREVGRYDTAIDDGCA